MVAPLTTREQAELIAALVHEIRPEWDTPGILAAIAKVAHRHPADVMMAAARLAMSEAKTPGALANQAAECWRERVAPVQVYRPPTKAEACPLHLSHFRDSCAGCEADRKAGANPGELQRPTRPAAPEVAAAAIQTMRAAVASVATPEGEK